LDAVTTVIDAVIADPLSGCYNKINYGWNVSNADNQHGGGYLENFGSNVEVVPRNDYLAPPAAGHLSPFVGLNGVGDVGRWPVSGQWYSVHIVYTPPITYFWTVPLILDHSYLVGNLKNSKIC
jgi:hypothetical protein